MIDWIAIAVCVVVVFGFFLNLWKMSRNDQRYLRKEEHHAICELVTKPIAHNLETVIKTTQAQAQDIVDVKVKLGQVGENVKMLVNKNGMTPKE